MLNGYQIIMKGIGIIMSSLSSFSFSSKFGSNSLKNTAILTARINDITKSSVSPSFAAYPLPDAIKVFNSLTRALLATCNFLVSIKFFNLAQADNFDLLVVVKPFRYTLLDPCFLGSLKNIPLIFSSPNSLIATKAASPKVLFSTL